VSAGLATHNITFDASFNFTNTFAVQTATCPGNTFTAGDVLQYRITVSLVVEWLAAICYKVVGDTVTFFVTDQTPHLIGGIGPSDGLSNDSGATYVTITAYPTARNYAMFDVPGNNYSIGDKVRILSVSMGNFTQCDHTNGWAVVDDVFSSQYVSLTLNDYSLNITNADLIRFPTEWGVTGTIARYVDTGPGLYYVNFTYQPVTVNDCGSGSPHRASGQSSTFNAYATPRPGGDIVVVYRGANGISFATLSNAWADTQVIATVDANLINYQIIDAYPDTLGGVYLLLGTGTPASIMPAQVSNFFVIRINPDNTFTSPVALPISPYIQNDPANLAAGDFAISDPCGGTEAPFQTFAVGKLLVHGGSVFIPVRIANKHLVLLVCVEGTNVWSGAAETVPAYFGTPNIMTGFDSMPATIQYVNGGVYVVYQLYVNTASAFSYPAYTYAQRTGANAYTPVSGLFTDTNSAAFAQVAHNQICMGWEPVANVPMFMPITNGIASYTFAYAGTPDPPPPPPPVLITKNSMAGGGSGGACAPCAPSLMGKLKVGRSRRL
jgi:hypothetical protein